MSHLKYSSGVIKWNQTEIRTMNIKTRNLLTTHGALHSRSDEDRRDDGLTNLEASHEIANQ